VGLGLLIFQVSRSQSVRHTTFSKNPLDKWSARRSNLYLSIHGTLTRDSCPWPKRDSNPQSQQASGHWYRLKYNFTRHFMSLSLIEKNAKLMFITWISIAEPKTDVPVHVMKVSWGSRVIAPLVLKLGKIERPASRSGYFTSEVITSGTHSIGS
jgi:hypothetical protein